MALDGTPGKGMSNDDDAYNGEEGETSMESSNATPGGKALSIYGRSFLGSFSATFRQHGRSAL